MGARPWFAVVVLIGCSDPATDEPDAHLPTLDAAPDAVVVPTIDAATQMMTDGAIDAVVPPAPDAVPADAAITPPVDAAPPEPPVDASPPDPPIDAAPPGPPDASPPDPPPVDASPPDPPPVDAAPPGPPDAAPDATPPGVPDAAPPVDAAPPDGPLPECVPSTTWCVGLDLHTCDATGHFGPSTTCAVACESTATPQPRCAGGLAPSNLDPATCAIAATTDLIVAASATTIINTSTGCPQVRTQAGGAPEICVYTYADVTIHGTLRAQGTRAFALVATGTLTIDGLVDARAIGSARGPGGALTGGGAFGTAGGSGSAAYGTPDLVPLWAGSKGNGMNYCAPFSGSNCGDGGGGGGAVQLVGCNAVDIAGNVEAAGGGGQGGFTPGLWGTSGGGGGSGGGVLIQGMTVTVTGALFANGGSGGGGSTISTVEVIGFYGGPGSDGLADVLPAPGGIGASDDCSRPGADGGDGGAEGYAPLPGETPPPTCGAGPWPCNGVCYNGGAGGAVGRIRIDTYAAAPDLTAAVSSPAVSVGMVPLDLP